MKAFIILLMLLTACTPEPKLFDVVLPDIPIPSDASIQSFTESQNEIRVIYSTRLSKEQLKNFYEKNLNSWDVTKDWYGAEVLQRHHAKGPKSFLLAVKDKSISIVFTK